MKLTQAIPGRLVRFLVAVAAIAALFGTADPVSAQTTYGWNVNSGSFQNPASWNPNTGVPGPVDTATISFGAVVATLDSDWSVGQLNFFYGDSELEMNGDTLTTNGMSTGSSYFDNGLVELMDGTLRLIGNANLGTGSNHTFNVSVDHAIFSATGYTNLATDSFGEFNLIVRNGGSYSTGGFNGSYIGSVGSAFVMVDGTGSSFSLGANSRIGNAGPGTVNIQNDGAMHTTGAISLAALSGSFGTVKLTDTGSSWTHTDGFITTGAGNAASITVDAGTMMTVTGTSAAAGITLGNHATLTAVGTVAVSGVGNSGITVNSGGTLTVNTLGSVTTQNLTRSGTGLLAVNGGTLTVNGGTFDNGSNQFNQATDGTFQLQNGATTVGITFLALSSSTAAPATVNVLSGSTFSDTGTIVIGSTPGGGAVLVDGPGSTLSTSLSSGSTVLFVGLGPASTGTLTVQNGGRYYQSDVNSSALIGLDSNASGTVAVIGVGSRFDVGDLHLGDGGIATLNITAGGAATSAQATIAEQTSSVGLATVSGAGSTWTTTNGLYLGGTSTAAGGAGSLTIANGGAVTVAGGQTKIWNAGTLTINGGSLTTGDFTRLGALNLQNGTLTVDGGQFDNGSLFADLAIQGNAANTLATLQFINGSYTKSLTVGNLSVGDSRPGALILTSGSSAAAEFGVSMATLPGGNSTIALSGANTELDSIGAITVGGGGSATLTIGAGSTVNDFDALVLNASGTVNLNGGTLTMNQFSPNGGTFIWTSGTVQYGGDATLDAPQLASLLGTGGALTAGHTLGNSSGTLTLTGNLGVAGGQFATAGFTNSANLTLSAGSIQVNNLLNLNQLAVSGGAVIVGAGGLSNSGQIQLTAPAATVSSAGSLVNGGLIIVTAGSITATSIGNSGEIQLASAGATIGSLGTTLTNTGRIDGTGRINTNLVNNANGTIAVDSSQRLVFGGSNNSNNFNGTISLTGGTVEFSGPLTNAAGGFISGRGTFRGNSANYVYGDPLNPVVDYGLKNSGVVAFSGGFSDVYGKVNNLADPSGGGQIINAGGGTLTFHDDVVNNGHEIRTVAGGRTVFFGAVSGAGPFTGAGTVEFDGDLRPGNSPASVAFAGNLDLEYGATLHIELGGTIPATQYDQVKVAGQLALSGALDAELYNGFKPVPGNSFDIVDWGSLSGTFDAVNLPTLNGRIVWDSSHLYDSGALGGTLSVIATYYAGDFNRDGHVDAADIALAMAALTDTADYQTEHGLTDPTLFGKVADVNGDGSFTNTDLQSLLNLLQSGGGSSDPVPEPASLVLFGLGALAIVYRCRSR